MKHTVTEHDMQQNAVDFMKRAIKLGDTIDIPETNTAAPTDAERNVGNYQSELKEAQQKEVTKKGGFLSGLFGSKKAE